MKKILLLGAMQMHVPLILRARERGIYVITCDYLPENVGHEYADESYYDSTTDIDAVLALAKKCKVDGIMTFNSYPAALTAAVVADKLGLPGSGAEAVRIMSEKDRFRTFLHDNGFNAPAFGRYEDANSLLKDINKFRFPVILKPVDSSGSKGVAIVKSHNEIKDIFDNAMNYSRCKRVIVEELINSKGAQMHGDAFVRDGRIEFVYLGDHHFNRGINNLVPISTTFPSCHTEKEQQMVKDEVERFISKVGFRQGGINIEARISSDDGKVYLIEVGPRNGGNFTPVVIQYATGYSFIDSCINSALGLDAFPQELSGKGFYAYMIVHSKNDGILKGIDINAFLKERIIEKYDYLKPGDHVRTFKGSNAAIGVFLVKFDSMEQMNSCVDNMDDYYNVVML